MSATSGAHAERFAHHSFNHRTVTEIQREVIKRGKQNTISRLFHANDKEIIATWRLDLDRILHIFNVRSVTSVWPLLTSRLQTKLGINIHVVDSDIRHEAVNTHPTVSDVHPDIPNTETIISDVRPGVSKPHTIVSEVRRDIANNRAIFSNVHRNTLTSREDTDGQNRAVSTTRALPVAK